MSILISRLSRNADKTYQNLFELAEAQVRFRLGNRISVSNSFIK